MGAEFDGKKIVVVGGSAGMGLALAPALVWPNIRVEIEVTAIRPSRHLPVGSRVTSRQVLSQEGFR